MRQLQFLLTVISHPVLPAPIEGYVEQVPEMAGETGCLRPDSAADWKAYQDGTFELQSIDCAVCCVLYVCVLFHSVMSNRSALVEMFTLP